DDVPVIVEIGVVRVSQPGPERASVWSVVAVNDELHRSLLSRVVALAYVKNRLPALDRDRLEDARLRVGIGIDVGERGVPVGELDQPQAADGVLVVVCEQR